jgi:hypothetical protein
MALTYTWTYVDREVAEVGGIVRAVTWQCTGTDTDGNSETIDGSTVFDVAAVLLDQPEGLTGQRPAFIETPTNEQCLQWIVDVHNAADFRLEALQKMLEIKLYGDPHDEVYPPVRPWLEEED